MIYVTSFDGASVEPLNNIGDDFNMEQSTDGNFTISFSCYRSNNPGYRLLENECVITVFDYDFRVKRISETTQGKIINAVSVFYDLSKTLVTGIFSGSHTLTNHLNFVLKSTGWTFTVGSGLTGANYIDKLGDGNVIELINKICKAHNCEYEIQTGKRVYFAKEIGPDLEYQFRYKYNVSDVVLEKDTTNLETAIKGYGKDGLVVTYRSPNVAAFGERWATPIKDERYADAQSLTNYIRSSIQDVPTIAIESRIPEITERAIGEKVWFIYEPLGIEMQTRILKQTKKLISTKLVTDTVVFGNKLPQTIEDAIIDQQFELDDTNKDIEMAKDEYRSRIEQTNNRITLEVEELDKSIAAVNIKADEIDLSVNNRITEEMAAINIKADNIKLSVENRITDEVAAINIRADEIDLSVSKVSQSVINTESSLNNRITEEVAAINLKADGINLSVSRVSSELNERITDEIAAITLKADNINLSVNDRINREIAAIDVRSDQIELNVQNLKTNTETSLGVLEGSINLKVNADGIISAINLSPESIDINSDKINLNGATMVNGTLTGGEINGAYINTIYDAYVGNTLYVGDDWNSGTKRIMFGRTGGGSGIMYTQDRLDLWAVNGVSVPDGLRASNWVNFSDASSMYGVVGSDTNNLFLAYSASSNSIWVRVGGRGSSYDVGRIQLT